MQKNNFNQMSSNQTMPNAKLCEIDIRIPFDSNVNAETICQVLSVDIDKHDRFAKQELSVADDYLCAHFTTTRAKDLRSGTSTFFESMLLCNEIVNAFATPPKESTN